MVVSQWQSSLPTAQSDSESQPKGRGPELGEGLDDRPRGSGLEGDQPRGSGLEGEGLEKAEGEKTDTI